MRPHFLISQGWPHERGGGGGTVHYKQETLHWLGFILLIGQILAMRIIWSINVSRFTNGPILYIYIYIYIYYKYITLLLSDVPKLPTSVWYQGMRRY